MARDVLVRLKGSDDLSPIFKKVGSGAKGAAQDIKGLEKDFDNLEQSSKDLERSLDDAYRAGEQIGRGLLTLGAASALAGKSYRDQQIQIDNLNRSYGDAADDMQRFAEQIQQTTNFSNDAAVSAANTAATLARNYGFTADEIQRVLTISADLAATAGIGLEDATYRVVAALRGEAEAAEALGLTMNQQAIDRDNLTLSMSNQEAGHFRLNALIEQSAFAQGAAAEQAESAYGSYKNLADTVQDYAQAVGGALGPVGELGALIADHPIQAAAAAIAFKELASAIQGINTATKMLTGMNIASAGLTGLTALMTGPAGIVVAAGLAGVAVKEFAGTLGPTFHQASDDAVESVDALIQKIVELGDTSALAQTVLGLDTIAQSYEQLNTQANEVIGRMGDWIARAKDMDDANAETVEGLMMSEASFDGLSQSVRDNIDANQDGIATLEELQNAQTYYNDEAVRTAEVLDGLKAGADELGQIFVMQGEGAAFAKSEANTYTQALLDGSITAKQYEEYLRALITGYGDTQEAALAAAAATEEAGTAAAGTAVDVTKLAGGYKDLNQYLESYKQNAQMGGKNLGGEHREAAEAMEKEAAAAEAAAIALQQYNEQKYFRIPSYDLPDGFLPDQVPKSQLNTQDLQAGDAAIEQSYALADAQKAMQDGIAGAADAMTYQVGESERLAAELEVQRAKAQKVIDQQTKMVDAMELVPNAAQALDNVFQSIVGNTNAIAQSSQGIADWATSLGTATEHSDEFGNSLGTWSRLDEILVGVDNGLSAATISQTEYNDAMDAFSTIAQENEEIQQNIAVIQAKQAPLIADQIELTENYTQAIAEMDAQQQAVALGFMDAAQAGRALELQQLAISAATGELGANGKDFAGDIIVGAAQADAQLRLMLESMGLISIGADGTITVNFQDNASDPIERLIQATEQLAYTQILISVDGDIEAANEKFEEIFGHAAEWDDTNVEGTLGLDSSDALSKAQEAQNAVDTFGRSTGTATLSVNDNASSVLQGAINLVGSFAGRTATATITTVYQTIGAPPKNAEFQDGGTIPAMADGGTSAYGYSRAAKNGLTATLVGERGPEVLMLPGGAQVMNTEGSRERWGGQPAFHFTNNGTIIGIDDLERQMMQSFSRAWVRANQINDRSMGR